MSGLLGRRSLSVKIGGKGVEDTIMQSLKLLDCTPLMNEALLLLVLLGSSTSPTGKLLLLLLPSCGLPETATLSTGIPYASNCSGVLFRSVSRCKS